MILLRFKKTKTTKKNNRKRSKIQTKWGKKLHQTKTLKLHFFFSDVLPSVYHSFLFSCCMFGGIEVKRTELKSDDRLGQS